MQSCSSRVKEEASEHHSPFNATWNHAVREDIAGSSVDVDMQPTEHVMENQVGLKEADPQGPILM